MDKMKENMFKVIEFFNKGMELSTVNKLPVCFLRDWKDYFFKDDLRYYIKKMYPKWRYLEDPEKNIITKKDLFKVIKHVFKYKSFRFVREDPLRWVYVGELVKTTGGYGPPACGRFMYSIKHEATLVSNPEDLPVEEGDIVAAIYSHPLCAPGVGIIKILAKRSELCLNEETQE